MTEVAKSAPESVARVNDAVTKAFATQQLPDAQRFIPQSLPPVQSLSKEAAFASAEPALSTTQPTLETEATEQAVDALEPALGTQSPTLDTQPRSHRPSGFRAKLAALATVPAFIIAACGGAAPATRTPEATATGTGTNTPAATEKASPTTTATATPKPEITPNGVVIPLSKILHPTEWPAKPVTNAQFEAAINSIQSIAATPNIAQAIHDCELGDNSGLDKIMSRLPTCENIAVHVLLAWNKGDSNAPAAFTTIWAYIASPNGGFANYAAPTAENAITKAMAGYGVPTN